MSHPKRRAPKQKRSRSTVDAIVHAASDVVRRGGLDGLNTNAVAERAGVSVGSIYEYFSNKEEILVALARQQLARDQATMLDALTWQPGETLESFAARVVRTLLALHAREHGVRRAAMSEHLAQGLSAEHTAVAELVSARLKDVEGDGVARLSPVALFVLSRSILGAVQAAHREQPALLESDEFARELTRLAVTQLRAQR